MTRFLESTSNEQSIFAALEANVQSVVTVCSAMTRPLDQHVA